MDETARSNEPPTSTPRDVRRREFAARLRKLMAERGWGVNETARRVKSHLPSGVGVSTASISFYKSGRVLPRFPILKAIGETFDTDLADLSDEAEPEKQRRAESRRKAPAQAPSFRLEDVGDGYASLQINQRLPWPVALQVLAALKAEPNAAASGAVTTEDPAEPT
jgi:transcriptional regulator with XRE-family HTH domain